MYYWWHSIIGTYLYMAPEVRGHKPYTEKADIWSLGMFLFEQTIWVISKKLQLKTANFKSLLHMKTNYYQNILWILFEKTNYVWIV